MGLTAGVASGAGGSQKFPLLGPLAGQFCDGSGIVGDTSQTGGLAVINYDTDTNMVLATVSLKGLDANTMSLQYLDALKQIGSSPSTKFVVPMELANLLSSVTGQTVRSFGNGQPASTEAPADQG